MKFMNTLTKRIDNFNPIHGKKVNMFVCGPTVYDFPHLGHAKTYTQFDFITKYLRYRGYDVFYLQNITDIDDKIIQRAKERKIEPKELAEDFERIYKEDMNSLGIDAVSEYARATDYIPQIVNQVKALIKKGYAYQLPDGYYFDLKKFKDYGKLSGRTKLQDNDAQSRIDDNDKKKNKGDFCLWKNYKSGEPFWETELGKGRPGWHIEDTAITETNFGPQYDIHGGAVDLIFPHHEAEIAQMESASGKKPLVRYWLHTGFLNINSEKMSKSKGNFFTIRDVLKKYDYRVLRYFFLSNHYRTPIDFTSDVLEQSKSALQRIDDFIFNIKDTHSSSEEELIKKYRTIIIEALDDDVNTPIAFAHLFGFIKEMNKEGLAGKNTLKFMNELNSFFGFMKFDFGSANQEIEELANKREEARKKKEFKEADRLRDIIKQKGFIVDDTPEGIKIRKI